MKINFYCFLILIDFYYFFVFVNKCVQTDIPKSNSLISKPTVRSIGSKADFIQDAADIYKILGNKTFSNFKNILTQRNCSERLKIREERDKKHKNDDVNSLVNNFKFNLNL